MVRQGQVGGQGAQERDEPCHAHSATAQQTRLFLLAGCEPGEHADQNVGNHDQKKTATSGHVASIHEAAHGVNRDQQRPVPKIVGPLGSAKIVEPMTFEKRPRQLCCQLRLSHDRWRGQVPIGQARKGRHQRQRRRQLAPQGRHGQHRKGQRSAHTVKEVLQMAEKKQHRDRRCPEPAEGKSTAGLRVRQLGHFREQPQHDRQRQREADESVVQRQVVRQRKS